MLYQLSYASIAKPSESITAARKLQASEKALAARPVPISIPASDLSASIALMGKKLNPRCGYQPAVLKP